MHPNFNQDHLASRIRMVTNRETSKNPLAFTDPTDRMAATLAKAQRIVNSDWYKKLPKEYQNYTKQAYYESYVVPAYKNSGLKIPDANTWINNIETTKDSPSQYYRPEGWQDSAHFAASVMSEAGDIFRGMSNAGVWIGKEEALGKLGLGAIFTAPFSHGDTLKYFSEIAKAQGLDYNRDKAQEKINNISNGIFGNYDFWSQNHPSQTIGQKISSGTGELIVQLPLYEALGGALGVAGSSALETLPKGSKLTELLTQTSKGKFVASRLKDAASGYFGGLLSNESAKGSLADALVFMGFGAGTDGLGSGLTKLGSSLEAKKLTANTLAIGGEPLQESITNESEHELNNLILGKDHLGLEIKVVPVTDESGVIHYGDQALSYSNQEELHSKLTPLIQHVQMADPVKFELMTAEKGVLNSISVVQFGKTYNKLSPAEKAATRIVRQQQVEESITEFPIHQPEITHAQIESDLAKERKNNPQLDSTINYLESKYGDKFSSEIANAEADKLAEQTGIKNPSLASEKVAKIQRQLDTESKATQAEAIEQEPRKYYSLKTQSLSYFKNPRPKNAQFNYEKWLSDMSDEDLDKEIESHLGNNWFFENPKHMMLWAYQYKNEMPEPFRNRIVERLQELDPQGNPEIWSKASKNMERHLDKLAQTGKLWSEGNVFRSSIFDSWKDRTSWQKELNLDLEKVDQKNLSKVLAPFNRNFPEEVILAKQTLKQLHSLRRAAIDADVDLHLTSTIKKFPEDIKDAFKFMKKGSK